MSAWSDRYAEINEKFECHHEHTRSTKRTVAGGAIQYVQQCLRCGKATTQAIAKLDALAANCGNEPEPFDDELLKSWHKRKSSAYEDVRVEVKAYLQGEKDFVELQSKEWRKKYAAYQKSPEWSALKEKVMLRAQGICEGCRDQKATVMHHLTYAHVFNELLFELVAVCADCHHKTHKRSSCRSVP